MNHHCYQKKKAFMSHDLCIMMIFLKNVYPFKKNFVPELKTCQYHQGAWLPALQHLPCLHGQHSI